MLFAFYQTTRLVLHQYHVPAKAKNDAFRFYLCSQLYISCPIFRLFFFPDIKILLVFLVNVLMCTEENLSLLVTYHVSYIEFIATRVTRVDSIVAHIDISLFPILRINSADDVIMTSLK